MAYAITYRRYRRPFRSPPRGGAGGWRAREGILLRLEDPSGRTAYGEVAPLEAFGTESPDTAEAYLRELAGRLTWDDIDSVPEGLPCCRFALESAREDLAGRAATTDRGLAEVPVAGLLPAGEAGESRLPELLDAGYRTLKWKIGAAPARAEQDRFRRMRARAGDRVAWRLDANGGLDRADLGSWGPVLEGAPVEYLEQPFPPGQESTMESFAASFPVPLALDESVGTLPALRRWAQSPWSGLFVVKPALAGSPAALAGLIESSGIGDRVVFSSALETGVGMRHALRPAFRPGRDGRAVGWGVAGLFGDDGFAPDWGAVIIRSRMEKMDAATVWERAADPSATGSAATSRNE